MNNEQTKTPGLVAYETHQNILGDCVIWDEATSLKRERWERVASAVISYVLGGAKYVLLDFHTLIEKGDEELRLNTWLPVREAWVGTECGHALIRRPISLPSSVRPEGKPQGPSTTPPASSGAAGADVPEGTETCPMCGGLGDDESHRIAMLSRGEPSIAKLCSLCRGKGVIQSVEPVVEEKPATDACKNCSSMAGVLNIGTLSGPMYMCCSCLCKLTSERDQLQRELEHEKELLAKAGASILEHIQERDQLRQENEDLSLELANKESLWREAIEARNQMTRERNEESKRANRLTTENAELKERVREESAQCVTYHDEITRLRSQFRWTPISERLPTEKDADKGAAVWVLDADGRALFCHWRSVEQESWQHWMTPIAIPDPSPKTEEQDPGYPKKAISFGEFENLLPDGNDLSGREKFLLWMAHSLAFEKSTP